MENGEWRMENCDLKFSILHSLFFLFVSGFCFAYLVTCNSNQIKFYDEVNFTSHVDSPRCACPAFNC